MKRRFLSLLCSLATLAVLAAPALAAPGGTGIERAGASTLDFLSGTLGPIVLGLGIAIAAYGMIFGSRDAIQKAAYVGIGGVILFSVDSIVGFIASAAG